MDDAPVYTEAEEAEAAELRDFIAALFDDEGDR